MGQESPFDNTNRRRFLQGTGSAAAAITLAGCAGDEPDTDDATPEDDDTEETDDVTTPEEEEDPDEIPTGGYFTFGMTQGATGTNWITVSDMYTTLILDLVYEGGTVTDPYTNEVRPWVFEDWEHDLTDDDELDVFFDVRDGLTWTDGEEFTVDDVLFTYEFFEEHEPGEIISDTGPIEFVREADNGWDLHMRIDEPISVYAGVQLQLTLIPEHIWSDVDEYIEYAPHEVPELEEGPVGLGPGTITRYEPDTTVEVTFRDPDSYGLLNLDWIEEHEHFRAGGPFLDGVRFNIYGSTSALNEAVLQGDVDALYDLPDPGYFGQMEESENIEFVLGHDSGWNHYSFNLRNPPLDCTSFRQILGFVFDDIYWVDQLNEGRAFHGNFAQPPAYITARPEYELGEEYIMDHDGSRAFMFREEQPGVVDVEGVRDWLREGRVVDGTEGEYLGREYPGSFTGVESSESEARHEYTFDEVESDVLDEEIVDQEIRVNGETIENLLGRPLEMLMYPPQDSPLGTQMVENFVGQLHRVGVPVERSVMTFSTMLSEVYTDGNFDIYPMGWTNQAPDGVQTLNNLFHSREAHEELPGDGFGANPMGYGLDGMPGADEYIDQARTTMDVEERNSYTRRATEKIYLDFPTMITSNEQPHWPVNAVDFQGYLTDLPDPGSSGNTSWVFRMIYPQE